MRVIDTDTNEQFLFNPTAEYRADMAALQEQAHCIHTKAELRERSVKGGATQIVAQCLRCGEAAGPPIKRTAAPKLLPPWDEKLRKGFDDWRRAELARITQKHVRIQRDGREDFWDKYAEYLQSEAWATKRSKIMTRARGVCEGCGERQATQVHHLTYARVFNEMLFDLVAVCDDCHDRCHTKDEPDELA